MRELLKLKPYLKSTIWGGERLSVYYHKQEKHIGEAWELSAVAECCSTLDSGEKLDSFWKRTGEGCFPLLIKLLDAKDPLSVQVHPTDEAAIQMGLPGGKTELWVILDAKEDAFLYLGPKRDTTLAEMQSAIKQGELLSLLRQVRVRTGDCFYIPAGTIHAIGGGITLYEIQQNADVTFRLYDYDRKENNGNLRTLHIEQALTCVNLSPWQNHPIAAERNIAGGGVQFIADTPFFCLTRYQVFGKMTLQVSGPFLCVTAVLGKGFVSSAKETVTISMGESLFIPASTSKFNIQGDHLTILVASVPW